MRPASFRTRTGVLAVLAMSLAACADRADSVAGIPDGAADGLYPQIVVSGATAKRGELRLSLLTRPSGVRLGSLQGELRYDPAVMRIERAALPDGVEGALNQDVPGRIRFVVTALDGFAEGPLLSASFSRTGAMKPESFGISIEEVSAAADLSDLTAQVSGTPIISLN